MQEIEPGIIDPREQAAKEFDAKLKEKSQTPEQAEKARELLISNYITEAKKYISKELVGKNLSTGEKVLAEKTGEPAWDKIGIWTTSTHGEQGRIAPFADLLQSREGELAMKKFIDQQEIADQNIINEIEKRLRY